MNLNVQQSRLWKMPAVVFNILRHVFVQDPLPILTNTKVYFYQDKGVLVSYCTFTEGRDYQQLKDVFTFDAHRQRGHATSLIKEVLLYKKNPTYLICKRSMRSFYTKIGFQETLHLPFRVSLRLKTGNFLSQLFLRGACSAMVFRP